MADNGTTIGKAYVQIVPSAKGIKSSTEQILNKEMGDSGTKAGASFGNSIVSKIKMVIAAAGIGKVIADTITAGGALQQSLGGAQKIYEEAYEDMRKNAEKAFKTSGVSMNAYLQQANSVGAALKRSLGGSATEAAKMADIAIRDMSDNANMFGSDLGMIQETYQSLARGNYEMLDNLKLGYGGTKTELQNLMKHANEWNAQQGRHTNYQIENYADIVSAIHDIQVEQKVTGTTAAEAEKTFSGSFASMKAAVENLKAKLALGEDIKPALDEVVETTKTFVMDNLVPMLENIGQGLLDNLPTIMKYVTELLFKIAEKINEKLPEIISKIAEGLGNAMPAFKPFFDFISTNAETVKNLLIAIVGAVVIAKITSGVNRLVSTFSEGFANIRSGIDKVTNAAKKIGELGGAAFTNIKAAGELAGTTIKTKWIGVSSKLQPLLTNIGKMGGAAFGAIGKAMSFLAAHPIILIISAIVVAIIWLWNNCEWFRDMVTALWEGLVIVLTAIWEGFKVTIETIWNIIVAIFKVAYDNTVLVWEGIVAFFQGLWDGICLVFNAVGEFFRGVFEFAYNNTVAVWEGVVGFFQGLWDGICRIFSVVGNWFKDRFTESVENVKRVWDGIVGFFKGIWDKICEIFTSIGTSIGDALSTAIKESINGILWVVENGINLPIRLINLAIDGINWIPGVDIPHVPELSLPRLAKGGVLSNGARMVIAGEDGDEAIVPLEKNTEWINKVARQFNATMPESEVSNQADKFDKIIELLTILTNQNPNIVMDTGQLVGIVDKGLGNLMTRRMRG